jgi:hypothetical protein
MAKLTRISFSVASAVLVAALASSSSHAQPLSRTMQDVTTGQTYQRPAPTKRAVQARRGQPRYVVVWDETRFYTRAEIEGIRRLERMN